ncbi:MAG: amino acid ABC transporter permease [Erysipelotrichaceae bacterium]|nr:amino acid ABC transporter permease [Erysipelotrichaceae bacterium]
MNERMWEIFTSSFTRILLPGLLVTIPLTVLAFILAMIIAVIVAFIRFANIRVLKDICRFYVWIIRGTPLLVQLFFAYYGMPVLGITWNSPFVCAVVVFALNEGAYASETIRGSLNAVPEGQIEAGYCVGMSYLQTMIRIVLPQALRAAFPALMNGLIGMVKDTSLASNITVTEMFFTTRTIVTTTYEPLLLYFEVAVIYLIFSTVLSKVQNIVEKKLNAQVGKE